MVSSISVSSAFPVQREFSLSPIHEDTAQKVMQSIKEEFCIITQLHNDLLKEVFTHLSVRDLLQIRLVEKKWYALVETGWELKCKRCSGLKKLPEEIILKPLFIYLCLERLEQLERQGTQQEEVYEDFRPLKLMIRTLEDPCKDVCLKMLCTKMAGDFNLMRWLSYAGFNVLNFLLRENNSSFVKAILQEGVVNLEMTCDGLTALHTALLDPVGHGIHFDLIKRMIKKRANVNARIDTGSFFGYTPLLCSIYHEENERAKNELLTVIRMLIDAGADVNATDKEELTPLHLACEKGMWEIVQLLLDAQASIDPVQNVYYRSWRHTHFCAHTPLHRAILYFNPESPAQGNPLWMQTIKNMCEAGADLTGKKNEGYTALHLACYIGCLELVEYLIQRTPCLNAKIPTKEKRIQVISEYISYLNKERYFYFQDLIERNELFKKSATLEMNKEMELEGATALHVTISFWSPTNREDQKNRLLIVQRLLDAGTHIHVLDHHDQSPIDRAREKGCKDILELLLKKMA